MQQNFGTKFKKEDIDFLIDTHCHLDFKNFSKDLDLIIDRALKNRVKRMITISTLVKNFPQLLEIVQKYENVYCSIGTHPLSAGEESEITAAQILSFLKYEKLVAIGECGLDYHYKDVDPKIQKKVFFEHIEASQESQLPLVIHARSADEDMIQILEESILKKPFPFILHCYSSKEKLARTGIDLGGYLSFSGIVTFKNAQEVQKIASLTPMDRILVETDSPYLAPVPFRGQRNEPSFVLETARYLAKLKGLDFIEFSNQTSYNALNLFWKNEL